MQSRNITAIMLPCAEDLPRQPCVEAEEKISRAIETMITHNLNRIAVVRRNRVVGMVHLADALEVLGVKLPADVD